MKHVLFLVAAVACLAPAVGPPIALAMGLALALTLGNPFREGTGKLVKPLLQTSVVLLGFGMDLPAVLTVGAHGVVLAAATIGLTLALAAVLGRLLAVDPTASTLIGSGTAICGGSAIAAVGGVLDAKHGPMTVALGTIFILNAVALYVFPPIGHLFGLTQEQFGTWAGIAIHDVSSVVAAGDAYGPHALEVATAVKLSRTLWIVPVSLFAGYLHRRHQARTSSSATPGRRSAPFPWFICLFLGASLARTFVPALATAAPDLVLIAKAGLTVVLFLIGAGMSLPMLRQTGWRPLAQGALLWLFISTLSLSMIMATT